MLTTADLRETAVLLAVYQRTRLRIFDQDLCHGVTWIENLSIRTSLILPLEVKYPVHPPLSCQIGVEKPAQPPPKTSPTYCVL